MKKIYIFKLFAISFLVTLLTLFIEKYYKVENVNPYEKEFQDYKMLMYAIIGIIVPIIEEFIFRYNLIKTRYTYIVFIFSSLAFILFFKNTSYAVALFVTLQIISFCFYFFKRKERLPLWLISIYAVYFTLLHIGNYDVSILKKYPIYIGILCIEYLLFSGFISYVRLKERNFCWVLFFHICYNFLGLIYH